MDNSFVENIKIEILKIPRNINSEYCTNSFENIIVIMTNLLREKIYYFL